MPSASRIRAHHVPDAVPRTRPRPGFRRGRGLGRPARGAPPRAAGPRLRRFSWRVTGGELLWRNAASSLNAEPAERYAVFQKLPPEQLQGLQLLKAELAERHAQGERPARRNPRPRRRLAERLDGARARGHHRLQPARACPITSARSVPARTPSIRTCANFRARSAATSAASPVCWASNTWCSTAPSSVCRRHFPRLAGTRSSSTAPARCGSIASTPSAPRAYLATKLMPVEFGERPGAGGTAGVRPQPRGADRAGRRADSRATTAPATAPRTPIQPTAPRRSRSTAATPSRSRWRPTATACSSCTTSSIRAGRLTVDGQRRPILRANLLFRGVEVSPGRHRIEFKFRPLSIDNLSAAAADLMSKNEDDNQETVTR